MTLPSGRGCWVSRSMMSDQFGPVAMMVCLGATSRMACAAAAWIPAQR